MKAKNSFISVAFAVLLVLFILSFSIALPILFRPFYYLHIDTYNLDAYSGYTKEEIITAYDEVLDYLIFPGGEYACGEMKYSPEGKAHFEDCKTLFMLNNCTLIISAALITVILILRKKKKIAPLIIKKHTAAYYGGIFALILPAIILVLACLDFNATFTLFHKIFFPGKDNWMLYPHLDEIINVLPWQFFRNCAILIGVSVLSLSMFSIFYKNKKS